jgi:hypothetical protein
LRRKQPAKAKKVAPVDVRKAAPKNVPVQFVNARTPAAKATAREGACSSKTSSTISSLLQNTLPSPEVPLTVRCSTRALEDSWVDSDSDAGEDLDEEDNIYMHASASEDDDGRDVDAEDISMSASNNKKAGGIAEMLSGIHWKFCCNTKNVVDHDPPMQYNGPSGLKPRIANSFLDPFECVGLCGGLDYEFVTCLARKSNEYARKHLLSKDCNSQMYGQTYENISRFLYHGL